MNDVAWIEPEACYHVKLNILELSSRFETILFNTMVRIFSMYHFDGQMVDTVDDTSTLTVTNHNKLLIAQDDYSVEVKDLLSDQKKPLFVFSTVEKVHKICHCARGNYVATLEGKLAFKKSDRLTVRIYTNWESNFTEGSKKSKRLVRARIAGIVTPSGSFDEDFLDMMELPFPFTSPAILSVCQTTGKLIVTCGPTMHLFDQQFVPCNHGKTSHYMDFFAFTEVFQLDFIPIDVLISENIIASYSQDFVSVFKINKLGPKEREKLFTESQPDGDSSNSEITNSINETKSDPPKSLNITNLLKMARESQEDEIVKFVDSRSLPFMVTLKGINDSTSVRTKRLPFKFFERKSNYQHKPGKIRDILVETLREKNENFGIAAESILALHIQDPDELITKVALQVLYRPNAENDNPGPKLPLDPLTQLNSHFVSLNVLVSTYQEGYLFHASTTNFQESLRCVAVFNFTSQVMSLMFETCFLHVLTQTGLETYNLPSLHSTILQENMNLDKFSQYVSIMGMHPFMGIVDFIGSKDLIVILTSASEGKRGKDSLPWTVYSLKKPKLFEVYKEMIENSNSFKSRDDNTYNYLSLESFLILQMGLDSKLDVCNDTDDILVRSTHRINSLELAKIYFRSGKDSDLQIGSSVILAAKIELFDFIQSVELEPCDVSKGKIYLMKKWIELEKELTTIQVEWLIKKFEESNDVVELSSLVLSRKSICRNSGRKAIPCLKGHVALKAENSDVQVIYALAILYTQECLQNEAIKVLSYVNAGDQTYRKSFVSVVLKSWRFLFEEERTYAAYEVCLSDLSFLLCEHLPTVMGEILSGLVLKEKAYSVNTVFRIIIVPPGCPVFVRKGGLILRTVFEDVFSSGIQQDYEDSEIQSCLNMLTGSYVSELLQENVVIPEVSVNDSRSTHFVEKLPSFVDYLPALNGVNNATLRKLLELLWSRKLNEKMTKDITNAVRHTKLKLHIKAMQNSPEFAQDLVEHNCFDAVLPYAKSSLDSAKEWRDFISFIKQKIRELGQRGENTTRYEKILKDILNHLALNLTPSQLNAVLESIISKEDELYWQSMIRAEQISYANELKKTILISGQELSQLNAVS